MLIAASALYAAPATQPYGPSTVQTQLQVEVKSDVEELHIIRDNTDPKIITRAYELKHANPYTVRGYLLKLVEARSVNSSNVQVEALRFNDGRGVVLVSAEKYRFTDTENGDGFDSIVKKLDTPNLGYSGGSDCYIYYPRYNPAANLMEMLNQVGSTNEDAQFGPGTDYLMVDGQLNALLLAVTPWSWKHCEAMLEQYDRQIPEVLVNYQIIEIYHENDERVGLDFQNWKNNDGVDLFSAGIRSRRNWTTFMSGNVDNNGSHNTEFWNFNPKWNTRYIDFLLSKGHAKVMTSGSLLAQNRRPSHLFINSGFFYEQTDLSYLNPDPDATPRQPLSKILPLGVMQELIPGSKYLAVENGGFYQRLLGTLYGNVKYDTSEADRTNPETEAMIELINNVFAKTDSRTATAEPGVIHGKPQIAQTAEGFGLRFSITPVVTGSAATLEWNVETVSLLGWNGDGTPRHTESRANGKTQIGLQGKEVVIGGLHRAETVRSVSGLPWVKSLPVIGYLVSDENESLKKAEVVIIARCEPATPFDPLPTQVQENIGKITDSIQKGFDSPIDNLGYQQLWLDQDTEGMRSLLY